MDFLQIFPKQNIGGITIQATLEEKLIDTLRITEHPVERGSAITDHAYKLPAEVLLRCGWSNSSLSSLANAVSSVFSGGSLSSSDYIGGVYSQLLALQESRTLFDIMTTKRMYTNMLITGLIVNTDSQTSSILMVEAVCRQVIIVDTAATTLPPMANQSNPASTADTLKSGVKQAIPATPSNNWVVTPTAP